MVHAVEDLLQHITAVALRIQKLPAQLVVERFKIVANSGEIARHRHSHIEHILDSFLSLGGGEPFKLTQLCFFNLAVNARAFCLQTGHAAGDVLIGIPRQPLQSRANGFNTRGRHRGHRLFPALNGFQRG